MVSRSSCNRSCLNDALESTIVAPKGDGDDASSDDEDGDKRMLLFKEEGDEEELERTQAAVDLATSTPAAFKEEDGQFIIVLVGTLQNVFV